MKKLSKICAKIFITKIIIVYIDPKMLPVYMSNNMGVVQYIVLLVHSHYNFWKNIQWNNVNDVFVRKKLKVFSFNSGYVSGITNEFLKFVF